MILKCRGNEEYRNSDLRMIVLDILLLIYSLLDASPIPHDLPTSYNFVQSPGPSLKEPASSPTHRLSLHTNQPLRLAIRSRIAAIAPPLPFNFSTPRRFTMLQSIVLLLLASTSLAPLAYAQTQAQIQACANSIEMTSYQDPVEYQLDDTAQYTATFSYTSSRCYLPSTPIPVTVPALLNSGTEVSVKCTAVTFDSTGTFTTTCSRTQ